MPTSPANNAAIISMPATGGLRLALVCGGFNIMSDDENHAVGCSFLANLPRLGNSDAEIFDGIAFKAGNGQNRDLMPGLPFKLTQPLFELLCFLCCQNFG